MNRFIVTLIISVFSLSCMNPLIDEPGYDVENPEILLLGQSNATEELAININWNTQKPTAQINHGGNWIANWLNEDPGWAIIDKAFVRGRTTIDYIIWFQGESDWGCTDIAYYEQSLIEVLNIIYPNNEDISIIIIEVYATNSDPFTPSIRDVQEEMVIKHDNWYLIDSKPFPRKDTVHLNSQGVEELSKEIYSLIENIEEAQD